MSREFIIWATIAIYVIFMLMVGIISSKKSQDIEGFTVGGRSAGAWLSALSYGTAYFSAVMFIGYSGGSGWSYGLWSGLVGIGNAIFGSYLAWKVLARRTREVSFRFKIKSMPQLFEKRYQSPGMKLFSCIVIFIFLIPYSASVYKGLTSVCSVVLGVSEQVCMIVIAIASALVLVLGGYLATLKADFVQGFIMMFGVTALIAAVVICPKVGGLSAGMGTMVSFMKENAMLPLSGKAAVALISTILMTSFGTWGLPQMIHKYYGIKDDREVKRATIISTFFALLVAGGGYFIGSLSHLFFGNTLPDGGKDYLVPNMLIQANIPDILLGIILVLLISASVSTLASITLTASSTISMDLIKGRLKRDMNDATLSVLMRIICLAFVVFSYFLANYETPILELMSYSWGIISGAFLAPYLICLYWKGINRIGAWSGMLAGFLSAFVPVAISGFKTPNGPIYAVAAMLVSFLVCFVASKIAARCGHNEGAGDEEFYQFLKVKQRGDKAKA